MAISSRATRRAVGLAGLLGTAGAVHFIRSSVFEPLIPGPLRRVASARAWVLGSGAVELACAAAVAHPRTRRSGAGASAALFAVVLPGNVQMALNYRRSHRPAWQRALAYLRLPLQWPLVALALRVRRDSA